jgi:hypothetical protein
MAHLLYRPHIDHGDKVVTTDFLIREISLLVPGAASDELPVDLASCAVELNARGDVALICPAIFLFIGDNAPFAAPAVALLDRRLLAQDPALAWQNARLSIARRAIPTVGLEQIDCLFDGEEPAFVSTDSLTGTGRFRGAVIPVGAPREIPSATRVSFAIAGRVSVEHRLILTPLGKGA